MMPARLAGMMESLDGAPLLVLVERRQAKGVSMYTGYSEGHEWVGIASPPSALLRTAQEELRKS